MISEKRFIEPENNRVLFAIRIESPDSVKPSSSDRRRLDFQLLSGPALTEEEANQLIARAIAKVVNNPIPGTDC